MITVMITTMTCTVTTTKVVTDITRAPGALARTAAGKPRLGPEPSEHLPGPSFPAAGNGAVLRALDSSAPHEVARAVQQRGHRQELLPGHGVVEVAAQRLASRDLGSSDFTGGSESVYFCLVEITGFEIIETAEPREVIEGRDPVILISGGVLTKSASSSRARDPREPPHGGAMGKVRDLTGGGLTGVT